MDLQTANKSIKNGVIVGLVMTGFSLVFLLIILIFNIDFFGIGAYGFIDIALQLGLIYGLYRKSRTCAIILLIYVLFSKVVLGIDSGSFGSIAGALIFGYFFFQAMRGTFVYHKEMDVEQSKNTYDPDEMAPNESIHAQSGITSFTLGLGALIFSVLGFVIDSIISTNEIIDGIIGAVFLLCVIAFIVGVVFGLIGVIQGKNKRTFSWWGLSMNVGFISLFTLLLVIGLTTEL